MTIAVFGAGAFGTAISIALARGGRDVVLWARDAVRADQIERDRENRLYLPGAAFPDGLTITSRLDLAGSSDIALVAVPMQKHGIFIEVAAPFLQARALVSCAKGIDLRTGLGPTAILARRLPDRVVAVLTGPGFAADIGRGLGTAMTLACRDRSEGEGLQSALSTASLRLYLTDDVTGAEIGGALKNVIAIAAGAVMGAGLGESARAAVITRGFAEMTRIAVAFGARAETLMGLSGLGDLVLTCTSEQSRNYRLGLALGAGRAFDNAVTVEGASTAAAALSVATARGLDAPLTAAVASLVDGRATLKEVAETLIARPLKRE